MNQLDPGSGYSVANAVTTTGGGNGDLTIDITEIYAPTADGMIGIYNPSGYAALFDTSLLVTVDRTYTFPDKDGIFAMLSDVTAGYVPYTVASSDLDLGLNNLTAQSVFRYQMFTYFV
jgi:hypothetical protein